MNAVPPRRRLKIVVLGLTLSSSWGNGHATTYRALLRAMAARGHDVLFLERDKPWYADNRDLDRTDYCRLAFYDSVEDLEDWRAEIERADAVIVGSYVPDGITVGAWAQARARGVTAFYDIDTPVTVASLERGACDYLAADQIQGYDLYLSFTGGPMLARLEEEFGSPAARALYCSVDTRAYRPQPAAPEWDLSYLGTYSEDRQPALERLLLEPARRMPQLRCVVAGPQYPDAIDWPANVERIEHVPPARHPAFYAASRWTVNVTRADMVRAGWSPSVRLFEAGACATPVVSDRWDGLPALFSPDREIVIADTAERVIEVLSWPERRRLSVAEAARSRVEAEHSADRRAQELEGHLLEAAAARFAPGLTRTA